MNKKEKKRLINVLHESPRSISGFIFPFTVSTRHSHYPSNIFCQQLWAHQVPGRFIRRPERVIAITSSDRITYVEKK